MDAMSRAYEGIAINWTHVPHINDPLELPLASIIYVASRMFSPPLSPRTREGKPHSLIGSVNPRRTISGKLFPETFIPVTCKFEKIRYFHVRSGQNIRRRRIHPLMHELRNRTVQACDNHRCARQHSVEMKHIGGV